MPLLHRNHSLPRELASYKMVQLFRVLMIAGIYFGLALASLQLSFQHSNATPVWPPSGFAFAILLIYGLSSAPGIFLGATAVNFYFLASGQTPPLPAALISLITGAGNTAEAVAGYYLIKTFLPHLELSTLFQKVRSLFVFVSVSAFMCLVSSLVGATAILLGGIIHADMFFSVLFTWWTGDVSGVLLITPLVVGWYTAERKWQIPSLREIAELTLCICGILLMSGIVFLNWFEPSFVFTRAFFIIPFVIWAALRLNLQLLTLTLIVSALMAISGTIAGIGPFVSLSLNQSLITSEAFISINSVMVLLVYAATRERKEKEVFLQGVNEYLESTVEERTRELVSLNAALAEAQRLAHIGSWQWDIVANDIQWSDELRRIYGVSDEQQLDLNSYFEFIHPDDKIAVQQTIERAMKSNEAFSFYHRITRADGAVRILYAQGEVVSDEDGKPVRMQGIGQDVTEAKLAEDLLRQRTEELKEKNLELERKNQELASFNFAASHDLQEPLRKIHTFSEKILEKETHLSDYGRGLFGRIQHATSRMKALIQDLLYYAAVGTEQKDFVPTDLNQVLKDVQSDLQEKITESGAIIQAEHLPTVRAVPSQLYHVLLNVIGNSIKFRQPQLPPRIVINAELVNREAVDQHLVDGAAQYHHISVSDNGIGFDAGYAEKIFEIFQRLHGQSEYPGTGLGLAICKKIVASHRGIITADGQPGKGTAIHIYLPAP